MTHNNKKLKILLTNDDGIQAEGLRILAETAVKFGEVTVVAPVRQCSGMSQKLTIATPMALRKINDYPVKNVAAYSLDGTPVDCTKVAILRLLPEKPDIILSGINFGYNAGYDCANSGTVGAVYEAMTLGVPGIAFSNGVPNGAVFSGKGSDYSVVKRYLEEIITELMNTEIESTAFWNVNFPGCPLEEYKGILRGRGVGHIRPYKENLLPGTLEDGTPTYTLKDCLIDKSEAPEGSDIHALLNNYISIGKIHNAMML
ncbi:MAG: 5'/3'-nucleotidase SurE [Eubacteriales bacterium]|nr:5'/3'-nucleotidase SurE [Eubacteriales bacterium]